ncbi:MAG: hypothetical protein IJX11_02680 [Bacteroidales bacterium]|nr:hypothetical protein [Bacteroidales bacterium]
MNKELLKKILIYAGIILFFAVIAYGFVPQVLGGKIVNQSDISAWKGMANEAVTHNAAHPEDQTAWTNSMFGGMPTTATIDDFDGDWTKGIYKFLLLGKRPATYLFIALVGAFLLMLSMGINGIVAVAGAIAVAFCSYNMQIIQVGHNTKMQAIAFFPWVLAGIIFTYKAALGGKKTNWKEWLPKTILGAVLFAFALSMQIKANHIQITYYLAIVIFIYAIALFISLCINRERRAEIGRFFAASALLLVIGCVGIATNANKLIPTYEYSPYTMRGGSELSGSGDGHNAKGLDLEYATAWSYGIEETPNLLIPDFNGGSSAGALDMDSETGQLLKRAGQPNLKQVMKALPLYWGPQPFTAGPMYLGAISIFLFMLGAFLCKGREKWWMIVATVVAVLLAWGSHFMWFTRLWFEYAPLYNKFRTVSMALTVLQVTVPLLGFYALDRIIKEQYSKKEFMKAGYISYALTAGFCLLCVLVPGIAGTFTGAVDAGQPDVLIDALAADRQKLMTKDALRSLILISIVFLLIIWAYRTPKADAVGKDGSFVRKGRMTLVAFAMIFLVWIDLVSVGKRYLNKDHFITPKDFTAQYNPRPVDDMIHEDTSLGYRVLDISVNTFNSSVTSFHHRSIGGYSPVKLQRYQDLIEKYLNSEIRKTYDVASSAETVQEVSDSLPFLKVTSLLNGKYIILGDDFPPVENHHAMGSCWFVSEAVPAATPDDEIALLASTDLATTAVIGDDFAWAREAMSGKAAHVMSSEVETSPTGSISLTKYAPNELRYTYSTDADRAAIFSEIYYPKGWKAWIEPAGAYGEVKDGRYIPTADAREIELFRADWMLRGAIIPKGEGQLIMRFEPDSYRLGENISRASSITLLLLLLASAAGMAATNRRKEE